MIIIEENNDNNRIIIFEDENNTNAEQEDDKSEEDKVCMHYLKKEKTVPMGKIEHDEVFDELNGFEENEECSLRDIENEE